MMRKLTLSAMCIFFSSGILYAQGSFMHPGLLHSASDFELVKKRLSDNDPVAVQSLESLRNAPPVKGNWGGNWAVNETIIRGVAGDNYMNAYRNAARAYQCALLWKITGEEGYADVAIDVLNAYRTYNKSLGGNSNISLIPGFIGYQLLNAAEIMRDYAKWSPEDIELFKQYMIDVWFTVAQDFLERRHDTVEREGNWYHYHSNWGQGNALFCISLGVFCDLPDIYNYGMYWLKEGPGNESLYVGRTHPLTNGLGLCGFGWGQIPWFHKDDRGPLGYLCQTQESGRDQGHAMAALGLMSYGLQTAYNQGDNAFCNLNNSLIKGKAGSAMVAGAAEYVAMFNSMDNNIPEEAEIIASIPYKTNWWMTGLNWTGQGQWRPIWQLFINHYQNRMGIPMQYCTKMKNKIGIELGGGSYGNNSGGYDHTGFGDLMHYDEPVSADKVPTILFPVITIDGGTVRQYAEYKDIEPGTVVMLAANLPDGETDTGQWEWEDGVSGNNRQITVNHSGLYRLYYTNSHGVRSVQLFSLSMRGEGIRGTLSHTVTYNGETSAATEVAMGVGRSLTMTTSYTNWNYIESEKWYDENGKELADGGSYTYTQTDKKDHRLIFRLTNQSGVVIEKVLDIKYDANDYSNSLPDAYCENLSSWDTDIEGFKSASSALSTFSGQYIQLDRPSSENGMICWGLDAFRISQHISGLKAGKYELSASLIATQQGRKGESSKSYVKDVYLFANGVGVPVSSSDGVAERFKVVFWVGEDGSFSYGVENLSNQNCGYSANGMNFFAMDDYALQYKGTADLASDYARLRKEAAAVGADDVPSAVYDNLQDALKVSSADLSAMVILQKALGEAQLIMQRYDEYQSEYELIRSYVQSHGISDDSLESALSAYVSSADASSWYRAYEKMENAWNACLPSAVSVVKLTGRLQNARLNASPSELMYDADTRWLTDAEGGNFRILAIDGSDAQRGEAEGENMIERYCTGNFIDNQKLIYQQMSGMPIGRYIFKSAVQRGADQGAIELFVNNATATVLSNEVLKNYEVADEVTDGVLSVGVKSATGNGCQWVSMSDPVLVYYSPLVLLQEAVSEADSLDYGEDTDGALASALSFAHTMLSSGNATERMNAYTALKEVIAVYRKNNASTVHPYDMTALIKNADFNSRNTVPWTLTGGGGNYPAYNQGVMEFWHVTFDLHQTITGLPAGNYRLSVQARSDKGASNQVFSLYAQSGATVETAYPVYQTRADGTDAALHLGQNADELNADADESRLSLTITVAGGTLKIGAKCTDAATWCILNDFKLEYLGIDTGDLVKKWNEQNAVAEAMDQSLLPAGIREEMNKARQVDITGMTVDELSAVLSTLMAAVSEAQAAVPLYAEFQYLVSVTRSMAENSVPNLMATLNVFNREIETAVSDVEQLTVASEISKVYETLEKARQTYAAGAVPINGIYFDMTFKVKNASGKAEGSWLNDGAGNFGPVDNSERNGEYQGNVFFEKWDPQGSEFQDGTRPIYQTVTTLQNGRYELTAAAFRLNQSGGSVPSDGISLFFNQGRKEVTSDVLDYYTVEGYVTNRKADLGLVSGTGNTANWVGLADVKLLYYGVDTLELSENDNVFDIQDGWYGCVKLQQVLYADVWNLVCLPFDLTSTQIRGIFEDVKELDALQIDGEEYSLMFKDVRTMTAGVPYLVKVAQTGSSWVFDGVSLKASACTDNAVEVTQGNVKAVLKGTCVRSSLDEDGQYKFQYNSFRKAEFGETVNAFSAYVKIEGADPVLVNLYVDGILTAIGQISNDDNEERLVDVYGLNGMRLLQGVPMIEVSRYLQPGIYIINGKKITIH